MDYLDEEEDLFYSELFLYKAHYYWAIDSEPQNSAAQSRIGRARSPSAPATGRLGPTKLREFSFGSRGRRRRESARKSNHARSGVTQTGHRATAQLR